MHFSNSNKIYYVFLYNTLTNLQYRIINVKVNNRINWFIDTGVTVNAVYPGICTTDITRHLPYYKSITRYFIKPIAWLFLKSPAKGSQTLIHAALDPELENVTGQFIR